MNNRSIEIKVRLNRKEAEVLAKRVKRSGLSTALSLATRPRPTTTP